MTIGSCSDDGCECARFDQANYPGCNNTNFHYHWHCIPKSAQWTFHFSWPDQEYAPGGDLRVYATKNCVNQSLLFEGYAVNCQQYKGYVPGFPINDVLFEFDWDAECHNKDRFKIARATWQNTNHEWEMWELPRWLESEVVVTVELPSLGDPTGDIQDVYVVVNLPDWVADPREYQEIYEIVDGTCPDLPGYLIGTTPIVFNPLAGETENPFETTPLTGTLYRDGEIILGRGDTVIPTLNEWGAIIFALLLAGGVIWFVVRHRRRLSAA